MEGIDAILRDPKTGQRLYPKTYEWNIIDWNGNKLSNKLAGLVAENGLLKSNDLLQGELQLGKWDRQTGEFAEDATYISNVEYLPIVPGSQIFINFVDAYAFNKNNESSYITFYDVDKTFIGIHKSLENVIVPDNTSYFKFNIAHSQIVTLDDIHELQVSSYGRTLYEKDLIDLVDNEELKAAIAAIPTPDVSGQIAAHNQDALAHPDIRELINTKIAELLNSAPETLDTLGELATALNENKDVVNTLNAAVGNKLDKITNTGANNKAYVASKDGTQTSVDISSEVISNGAVQRGASGEILVRSIPTADNEAVSKKFVEDSIANNIPDVSSQIEEHNTSEKAHSDIRTEIETVRSEIPDVEDFLKYVEDNETEDEINPDYDYYKKTETYSAEEIDAKLAESGKIKSITVNGEATEIVDGNVDIPAPQEYDLIIKTQEEFEAFYTSLDNSTNKYKHVLLDGTSTFKFRRSDGKGIMLGREVESFHGVNSARIEIENLSTVNTGAHAAGIRYIDSTNELDKTTKRSFRDINIDVIAADGVNYVMGLFGMSNIYNCVCYIEASCPTYFSRCYNLNNCSFDHYDEEAARLLISFNGFSDCDTLINCTGSFIGSVRDNGASFNACTQLQNCNGMFYELGGNHSASNLSFYAYGFCSVLDSCVAECMTLNSRAIAFNVCDRVINSGGAAGGVISAIAFNECGNLISIQAVAVDIMETGQTEVITFNKCDAIECVSNVYGEPIFVDCTRVGATLEDLGGGAAGYDLVIDNQDKFDAFVQACKNQACTATSILIDGGTGETIPYYIKDNFILLPTTLKKIHGINSPVILAEYTEFLDIMCLFAYVEEMSDVNIAEYSIENLNIGVIGFYKPSALFWNCANIKNINIQSDGGPTNGFFRCINITNINMMHDINENYHEVFGIDINEFEYCKNINNVNLSVVNNTSKEGTFYAFRACENIGLYNLDGFTAALRPEDHTGVNKNIIATHADLPTKTSVLANDGDGTSKYATEAYVAANGGKIDVITYDGEPLEIVDKTVALKSQDVSNFITKEVNDLTYYTPTDQLATNLTAVVNNSTYEMTLTLKDSGSRIISTAVVDLPLETMVVDADYLADSKEIQLTLQNGTKTTFSVADLVSGLVSTEQLNTKLAEYLPLSGGKMTGKLSWEGLEALPQDTNPRHFLTIDAFSEGGVTKYVDIKDLKTALEVPTDYAPSSHSHDYLPITGGTVKNSGFGNQLTIERSDTGPTAIWFKTNGTSYGYIGITESKPAFWNSDHSSLEYLSLASHTHSQYAASDHTHSTYITQSQMETYVQEQIAAAITAALEAEY